MWLAHRINNVRFSFQLGLGLRLAVVLLCQFFNSYVISTSHTASKLHHIGPLEGDMPSFLSIYLIEGDMPTVFYCTVCGPYPGCSLNGLGTMPGGGLGTMPGGGLGMMLGLCSSDVLSSVMVLGMRVVL